MLNRKDLQISGWLAAGSALWGGAGAIGLLLLNANSAGFCLFSLAAMAGIAALAVSGYWHIQYNSWKTKLHTAKISAPKQCPSWTCKGNIALVEREIVSSLGYPHSELEMTCPQCGLKLTMDPPYTSWTIKVANPERDPEFSFLYDGESITDAQLHEIARGLHTKNAYAKLRSRALESLSRGDLSVLKNITAPMIHAGSSVQVQLLPVMQAGSDPDDHPLVLFRPVTLMEQRTRQGTPVWAQVTSGSLLLTSQRFLFDGYTKDVEKRLSDIEGCRAIENDLVIQRKGKKRLERFSGLDAGLTKAILDGVKR